MGWGILEPKSPIVCVPKRSKSIISFPFPFLFPLQSAHKHIIVFDIQMQPRPPNTQTTGCPGHLQHGGPRDPCTAAPHDATHGCAEPNTFVPKAVVVQQKMMTAHAIVNSTWYMSWSP